MSHMCVWGGRGPVYPCMQVHPSACMCVCVRVLVGGPGVPHTYAYINPWPPPGPPIAIDCYCRNQNVGADTVIIYKVVQKAYISGPHTTYILVYSVYTSISVCKAYMPLIRYFMYTICNMSICL